MTSDMPQTDASLRAATGRGWEEWRTLLDEWGADTKPHKEIARYVADDFGVRDWWAQAVTIGYERMIGRRASGQRNDGSYSASANKTMIAPPELVLECLVRDHRRSTWLTSEALTLRTHTPKSARFDEPESGLVVAFFLPPRGAKTAVQVQADGFPDADTSAGWKSRWKERLLALSAYLDSLPH